MKFNTRRTCLLFILCFAGSSLFATKYYIKPGGNDAANGLTIGTAWQNISRVNAAVFSPGDSILLEGGSSFSGNIFLDSTSLGTIKNPILISSYGTGKATIVAGNGHGFHAKNTAGIILKNLNFTGAGYTVNNGIGVYFFMDKRKNVKLKYIVMENLTVTGFRTSGLQVASWPADSSRSGYDTVIIRNCVAHDNGLSGISMSGFYKTNDTLYSHMHVLVSRCMVYNNHGFSGLSTHSGSGIIIGQADTCMIEFCEAWENGKNNDYSAAGPAGIWAWDSRMLRIRHCYSHHNRSQTIDGGGFDLDGGMRNSVMENNYSHDNDGPGFMVAQFSGARKMRNIAVRYNISERDGKGLGAMIWSGDPAGNLTAQKIDFYNNTIFADTSGNSLANACIAVYNNYGAMKDIRICNNIFTTRNNTPLIDIKATLNLKFYNNAYFDNGNGFKFIDKGNSYNSIILWRSATGQEILNGKNTGFKVDPMLLNPGAGKHVAGVDSLITLRAYRLNNLSPLIGTGIVIDTLYAFNDLIEDFYSDTIHLNNQYTPGAHEIDAPKAQFSISNSCKGVLSKFVNRSLKSEIYLWKFGDGSTSTSFNPSYLYTNAGKYVVTLIVKGKFGYIDSIKKNIEIYELPSAAFTSSGKLCPDHQVTYSSAGNTGVNYQWKFDDSTTDTGPQSIHRFRYPGNHLVKLLATISTCRDSSVSNTWIYYSPAAAFSATSQCPATPVLFTNLSNLDNSYSWDFGDSSFSSAKNPLHSYRYSGSHPVQLVVTSPDNCNDTILKMVEIYENPVADFITGNHCFRDTVPLENLSKNDSLSSWDFGEGTTSDLRSPELIAKQSGPVNITLIVTSKNNCMDTLQKPVEIYALPSADFTFTRVTDSFYFKAKDTSLQNYYWNVNDTVWSFGQYGATFMFSHKGPQKVLLKTINNQGCQDTLSKHILYIPTSLNGLSKETEIIVFPNPFPGKFTLRYGGKAATIRITDMTGREIYHFGLKGDISGNHEFTFNESIYPLQKGMYNLTFSNGEFTLTKIIVNE